MFSSKNLSFPLTFSKKRINLVLIKRRLIMALEFNENNFKEEVLNSDKPVLVDFWAVWCGPCKLLGPTIDELHKELEGKVKVGKVNVDENQNLAAQFGVMSIPTVIIMKGGKVVEQFIGMQPKGVYIDALNKHM